MRVSATALAGRSGNLNKALVIPLLVLLVMSSLAVFPQTALAAWDWDQVGSCVIPSAVNSLVLVDYKLYAGCNNGAVYERLWCTGGWVQTGSSMPGSPVFSLTYDGTYLYAGCQNGGVYRNSLSGGNWEQLGTNIPGSDVFTLLYANSKLYAGCKDGRVYQNDLLKSDWTQVGSNLAGYSVYSLAYDGTNLYAGCLYPEVVIMIFPPHDFNNTICKNDLSGGPWTEFGTNIPSSSVFSVVCESGNMFIGCANGTVYQNSVSGGVWTQTGSNTPGASVNALAYDGEYIYAGCGNGTLQRNNLSGERWAQVGDNLNSPIRALVAKLMTYSDYQVYVYACTGPGDDLMHDEDIPYSRSGSDVFASKPNSPEPHWFGVNGSNPSVPIYSLVFDGAKNLYAGGGSFDYFAIPENPMPDDYGDICVNDESTGIWKGLSIAVPGSSVRSMVYSGTELFAGCFDGTVYRNGLTGAGWIQIDNDLPKSYPASLVYLNGILYAGCENGSIYQNDLSGGAWVQTGSNVPGGDLNSLANDGTRLYAGCSDGNVYENDLSGGPWVQTGSNSPGSSVTSLIYFNSKLYAGCSEGKVFCNSLQGGMWTQVGDELFEGVTDLVCDGHYLYASGNNRVYRNNLWNDEWNQVGQDFPGGSNVNVLAQNGTYLYVGGNDGLVYRLNTEAPQCNINASVKGDGGTVEPATHKADLFSNATIRINPLPGWHLESLIDNGRDMTRCADDTYTVQYLEEDHEIVVEFSQDPVDVPPDIQRSDAWYLAEGSTSWGFDTFVTIQNPNDNTVEAEITFMTDEGSVPGLTVELAPESQTTVNPANLLGARDFSTKVVAKGDQGIAVDRTMSWTGPGAPSPEGHSSIGVNRPSGAWYLSEGSSAWGFETWLLVQNPNESQATCNLTYMIEGEDPVTVKKVVPGNSRMSFNMADDIGARDASMKVESDTPIICERSVYRNNRREGHCSIGSTGPSNDYYLAEGTTAWGFTSYLLVQNPGDELSDVSITYMTPGGSVTKPAFTMPPNSRETVLVNDVMPNTDFSAKVHGSRPIIAERAVYWGAGTSQGEACHESIGMPSLHGTHYFPGGRTSDSHETWVLVQNPNPAAVEIEVAYLPTAGNDVIRFTDTVDAKSRKSFNMADKVPSGNAATVVTCKTAGTKIMCERSMYWNNRGAGTATIGAFED